jgi:uncharacterized protein YbjQ (UPF0145 family)
MTHAVDLYESPWVSGMRAASYYPATMAEIFLLDSEVIDREAEWTEAEINLLDLMRSKAESLGCNAVVGMDIMMDPFAETEAGCGLRLRAVGTPVVLESLF